MFTISDATGRPSDELSPWQVGTGSARLSPRRAFPLDRGKRKKTDFSQTRSKFMDYRKNMVFSRLEDAPSEYRLTLPLRARVF